MHCIYFMDQVQMTMEEMTLEDGKIANSSRGHRAGGLRTGKTMCFAQ
jgi:hypothetical protein